MVPLLFIASFDFIIAVVRRIRFAWGWVWWTWVWIRSLWYLLLSWFSFKWWRVPFWCFCVWIFFISRSWVQSWLTPFNIFALKLKLVIFHPNFKIGLSFLQYSLIFRLHHLQLLRFVLQHDPPHSNGWHQASFWFWWQGYIYRLIYPVCQHQMAHNSWIVVPQDWRDISQGSPHSAHRDPLYNYRRVFHWTIRLEQVEQSYHWRTFHQSKCSMHYTFWDLGGWIVIYYQS